ncbi:MAG TPA: hypothetical protein VLV15_01095, partial [Dongiaceae bacterium]|nr:hypothetical protein [Dongiaceae bacterium]
KIVATALLCAALAACGGGSDTTGPGDGTVNGTWSGSASNVTGSGVTCDGTGLKLMLTQSDATFTGSYTLVKLSCSGPGGSSSGGPFGGAVTNGTITGASVSFTLDTGELAFTGTLSGNTMSGSTVWTLDLGPPYGTVVLTGNWTAKRS